MFESPRGGVVAPPNAIENAFCSKTSTRDSAEVESKFSDGVDVSSKSDGEVWPIRNGPNRQILRLAVPQDRVQKLHSRVCRPDICKSSQAGDRRNAVAKGVLVVHG